MCLSECLISHLCLWAWMNQALKLDLKSSLTLKGFLSESFGVICMSETHRGCDVTSNMTMTCIERAWSEQRPCLHLDGLLAAVVEFLAVIRVHAISASARFTFDLGTTGVFNTISTHLKKLHSLSHHTAQPGRMYHMTCPAHAKRARAQHTGLTLLWNCRLVDKLLKPFICSTSVSLFSVHVGGFDIGNGHVAAEHIHSACDVWWWWNNKQLTKGLP